MNINFSWFPSVWKSENMVVILLKSTSLSVVNRSQLVRKWTSSSRISHLGHSLSAMGVRGAYVFLYYMDHLGPFSTILIGPKWDKMCNELISESTGPISTVKKSYESLRTSYMHYGTYFHDSKVIWNDARWLGHFIWTIEKPYESPWAADIGWLRHFPVWASFHKGTVSLHDIYGTGRISHSKMYIKQ